MSFVGKCSACAVLIALLGSLSGCGGGGDGSGGGGGGSGDSGPSGTVLLPEQGGSSAMACPTADMACTGDRILQTDHGIAVTASGVQVYAISTNDLLNPNPAPTLAYGLRPATGGIADVRVSKAADGRVATVTLLLSKLGLSWDGKTERPLIIETFSPKQGRVQLDQAGLARLEALPSFTDLNFFDFARKGAAGTQAHYANNIYFPRTEPARCPSNNAGCPSVESTGLTAQLGDWRSGGDIPDNAWGTRLHEEGATQAGAGIDANGQTNLLPGSDGPGVPYPGFKGYRDYHQWSYAHANLSAWITQDTVLINEWGGNNEHNKMRRGLVAFGQVTPAAQIPSTGTARYRGRLHGWFSYLQGEDSYPIFGEVDAEVDFTKRTVVLTFSGTRIDEGTLDSLPLALTATTSIGSAQLASYFSGTASHRSFSGGIGARFFGPTVSGGSGQGPAEIAGTFQLQTPNEGPVTIGGFLLKKI